MALQNLIFTKQNNSIIFKNCGLKNFELKMFFEGNKKTLYFHKNNDVKKVVADGFVYTNCDSISTDIFRKCDCFDIYL